MSKKNILASVRKMTEDILKTTDMELIDLEYVKEGPFKSVSYTHLRRNSGFL